MASAPSEPGPSVTLQRPSIIILLGVLLVAAMVTTSPIAYWLLYALGGLVILSYMWTRNAARSLDLRRRLRGHQITVGDEVQEDFELINTGRLPILLVEVDDHSELPGYQASVAESLGPRQRKRWISRGVASRRGLYGLGPTDLRIGDPFGIFASERRIDIRNTIVVYPPISIMADVEIPAGSMVGTSRSSIRTHQVTSDAGGIREFQPGDPLKRIHWLSSARRSQLLVKEFDLEPTANLWIALDLDRSVQAGHGDESTEEYGVKIVSSLAHQFVRDNKAVGFVALSRQGRYLIEPQKGLKQLWRILETLAVVQATGTAPFHEFLTASAAGLGRGTSLVAITPSADSRWLTSLTQLGHRAIYPMAVALDASTFGPAESNAGLSQAAAASGIGFVSVDRGMRFEMIRADGRNLADFERTQRRPVTLAPA